MSQLEAIIFDWAGTLVDVGSCAPRRAFVQLFEQYDVSITEEEASAPMGLEKRAHIVALFENKRIAEVWKKVHGSAATASQIDAMYQQLIPLQIAQINQCSELLPGFLDMLDTIAHRNLKYGTTTGYNREMIESMISSVEEQGFHPDCIVAANEVPNGRPSPAAALKNLIALEVNDVKHCVKVDDTAPGIDEGRSAGMWTVGVVVSGNAVGKSLAAWHALSEEQQQTLKAMGYQKLESAGAHYLIDSVNDLPGILHDIECRLARGEKP